LLGNRPGGRRKEVLADVFWGQKYEIGKRKRENVKGKGLKGKDDVKFDNLIVQNMQNGSNKGKKGVVKQLSG
jgi:hypothetical protein